MAQLHAKYLLPIQDFLPHYHSHTLLLRLYLPMKY